MDMVAVAAVATVSDLGSWIFDTGMWHMVIASAVVGNHDTLHCLSIGPSCRICHLVAARRIVPRHNAVAADLALDCGAADAQHTSAVERH